MNLPDIGGRRLDSSLGQFEMRCKVYIIQEQRAASPNTGLIALLCDAVRLAREFADILKPHDGDDRRTPEDLP